VLSMMKRVDFHENPNIGVYCRTNDSVLFLQKHLSNKLKKTIADTLDVKVVETSIADANIIGSLLVMNSTGALLPDFADLATASFIEKHGLHVGRIADIINAVGNDILVNDHGALVHPDMTAASMKIIEETFDIPVTKGTIAGLPTVGMAAVVTNNGCLSHPKITDAEKAVLEDVFDVEVMIGTVNHGFPMIGSGLVANTKGAIIGNQTTGIEMGRIEEALGFLE